MDASQKKGIALSVLVIALGAGWLLNVYEVLPGVDWVWTGALGLSGALICVLGGWNRLNAVVGPFLIAGSLLSILRQTGRLRVDVEVPLLVIVFGVLLLIAHALRLPLPEWLKPPPGDDRDRAA